MDFRTMFATLAGISAGVISAGFVSWTNTPEPAPVADSTATAVRTKTKSDEALSGEVSRLRAELRALASAGSASNDVLERLKQIEEQLQQAEGQAQEQGGARDTALLRAQTREEAYREFGERISQHKGDAIDPAWASTATGALEESLGEHSAFGGYETESVECRTTSCQVTLRWPTKESAGENLGKVATIPFKTNCAREVWLLDSTEANGNQLGTILLDCTDWRADGSELLSFNLPSAATSSDSLGNTQVVGNQ